MTTVLRSKENDCDFHLFKTPKRTSTLSSATMNDRVFYSNNLKHVAFTSTTNSNDLPMYTNPMMTPIHLNKTKFSTPLSLQRRRALGLVNSNNKQTCQISTNDDLKHDELVILQAPSPIKFFSCSDDDLPHRSTYHGQDTFNDLIPMNERIEHMMCHQSNGINIFTFHGGINNTIRYQSPQCSRIDISTLLDILN